ncbi:hypothetical protein SteCoe_9910 [Stentor coeruleus]|uniref:Uncharacterized protein n=1 Tax=Stentor coeruleus TaxID=5963 RepID=A0A1R2CGP3_9CILI|nr:hypothetical protein SteCoe_9910 [Stentor coeruleus]
MEVRPKKNLALALGKFSKLLIQEKIIDEDADKSALAQALGNAASNLSSSIDKSTRSSVDFVKGPLAVMMAKHEKSQNKIEKMRKQKEIEEKSHLKQKPSINGNSKRIVKYKQINIPPLHERTEKILKEKSIKLEVQRNHKRQQEDNEFLKNCTFKPHSQSQSSRSRSPEVLTKELYKWNENRTKELEKKRKEKSLKEDSEIKNKPKIDNLSTRLSKNRCITPVHKRLSSQTPKMVEKQTYSFVPQINEKSRKILIKKENQSRTSSRESSPIVTNNIMQGYFINTSRGGIDKHQKSINTLALTQRTKEFLSRIEIT